MGGPNLKPIIAMVVAAASILVAAIVSRVIGRFLMEPNVQENRIRRFLPIVWTFIACVALSVIVVWVIRAFLGGGADNSWLAAGKLFVANGLGIVAFLPLIVGRVQLRFFQTTNKTRNRREYTAILALVLAIFAATIFAWHATSTTLTERNQARFEALTIESEKALKNRLSAYEDAILGGAGLFYASDHVSRVEWRKYVSALDVVNRYPGINGIGYIPRVAPAELDTFLAYERYNGQPDFRIHPEVDNNTYYVITYIEPIDINQAAMGLNIAFEGNRKAAAELAARTGRSAITKRILLVQDAEKTPGFLLLYPIYNTGSFDELTNPEKDLMGWVYAPFIGKNLLGDLTASQGERIGISIYDGARADKSQLIFSEAGRVDAGPHDQPNFKKTSTFNIMQQDWTVEWVSTKSFEAATVDFQADLIMFAGTLIGGMLGLMLVSIAHRAASVQTEVDRKTP